MKRIQLINVVLAVVFLAITLAMPVRGLLSSRDYASETAASGTVVFDTESVNSSAKRAQYITLVLFASLTLVFAWRAIKPANKTAA